ncbi:penicillin acylase family protein, partial [candidate division CSSED10-310 bacterium]
FDAGPYHLPGGRATVYQGNLFHFWGRKTTFAPSYRIITDLGQNVIETNIPGGPSGRRFSHWYLTDVPRFFQGSYKKMLL